MSTRKFKKELLTDECEGCCREGVSCGNFVDEREAEGLPVCGSNPIIYKEKEKVRKFKVGDKVVPVSKSHGCILSRSANWEEGKDQGFLYLVRYEEQNICICNSTANQYEGDYFLEEDLIPYVEDTNPMPELKAGMVLYVKYFLMGSSLELVVSENHTISLDDPNLYSNILQGKSRTILGVYKIDRPCSYSTIKDNLTCIWKRKTEKDLQIEALEKEIEEKTKQLKELQNG